MTPYIIVKAAYGLRTKRRASFYEWYIRSPFWASKRAEVLKRDNYCCQRCGMTQRLEVHHKTYKRLGREWLRDLVTLCRHCHQWTHNKQEKNKK